MAEWQSLRLRDMCDAVDYGLTASAISESAGPRFLRITDIVNRDFDWLAVPYVTVTPDQAHKYKLHSGDIVIARTGATTGSSKWIGDPPDAVFASYLVRLKIAIEFDSRFVGYLLGSGQFTAYVKSVLGDKSAQPNASATTLTNAPLRIPVSKRTQEGIAALLGALDDKIAVNNQIVRGADELRACKLGLWERSNPDVVDRYPLSSFAGFVNGRAFTKDATGTGRMVIRIAEINSGPGTSTVYNDIDVPDVHLAMPGDVLFAWSGSLTVARWYQPEAIINQHIFKVIPNSGIPVWLAYELIRAKLADFKGIAAGKATTMGHIQRRHLDEMVPAPRPECVADLDAELGPLWDRALAAEQESLALLQLRDTLLPKLMSGEIRVRDAERVVGGAT